VALVVPPEKVEGDGVETVGLHLLENIAPGLGGGESPIVDFAGPNIEAFSIYFGSYIYPM